jgi:hypothetical protein
VRELEKRRRPQRRIGVGGQNSIGGSVGVWARNQLSGESIAQRSQRPQRGIWGGWPKFYRWQRGPPGEKSGAAEKHRTEVTEATEGDSGGWPKFYRWQRGPLGEKSGATEKHRTEVAEGDWVWWSKILSATAWASGPELIKRNGQSIVESYSGTRSMRKCKSPRRKERQLGS